MRSTLLLAATFVRLFLRDRLTVVLSVALMVFMMTLFGLVMGDEQFQVRLPIAVLDQSAAEPAHRPDPAATGTPRPPDPVLTSPARQLLQAMRDDELLELRPVTSPAEVTELLHRAQVVAGLVIAPGYGRAATPDHPGLQLVLADAPGKWSRIGIDRLEQLTRRVQGSAGAPPWQEQRQHVQVVRNRYIDFIFPGMLAMAIMQACLASGVVMLHAKKIGILRRLQLTPLTDAQLFGGFLGGRLVVVALHVAALSAVAVWGFGAQVQVPWWLLVAALAFGALTFMAIGLMIAALAPTFEAGNLLVQMLSFPMSFLCGVFFKIESMPAMLALLAKALPLSYLVDMVRGLANLGLPIGQFQTDLVVLGAWLLGALLLSAFGLRMASRKDA